MKLKEIGFMIFIAALIGISSCDIFETNEDETNDPASDVYCFWLAASKDAHVSMYTPDRNLGGVGELIVSNGSSTNDYHRIYIQTFY